MKYMVCTSRSEKSYSNYNAAVNQAIKAKGTIIALTDDVECLVPIVQVGKHYMYENYQVQCIGIHPNSVDLLAIGGSLPVHLMDISPLKVRDLGSVESIGFYRLKMSEKLQAEKPSVDTCRTLKNAIAQQLENAKADTPIKAEERCRLLGFNLAVEDCLEGRLSDPK